MTADADIIADLRAAGLTGEGDVVLEPLTGGVSCDVWKAETPSGPIVVKRPLPQLRVAAEWHAPVERGQAEVRWLRRARGVDPHMAPEVLAELPGYGFAKAPKDLVRKWRFLVNDYLRGRQVLKRTLLLIDSRHGIKDVDQDIMKMLDEAAVSYRIVMTKADKVKASDLAATCDRVIAEIRKRPAAHPDIVVTSSEKGMGIPELRAAVIDALE